MASNAAHPRIDKQQARTDKRQFNRTDSATLGLQVESPGVHQLVHAALRFRGRHSRPETGRRVSRSARHPAAQPYVARDQHRYRSSSHRQAARSHGPAIVPRTDIETFIPFRGPQDHTDTDEYRARTDEAGPQDRQHDRNTRQSGCTNKRQFHRADQR